MVKLFKKAIFRIFYSLKLDYCGWSFKNVQRKIFFAHRVIKEMDSVEGGNLYQHLSPQALERGKFIERLEWLLKHWRFVPIDHLFTSSLQTHKADRKGFAVLTFDDAYFDFSSVIYPILSQMRLPMTFFITVEALDQTKLLWFDKYYSAIAGASKKNINLSTIEGKRYCLETINHKVNAVIELHEILTNLEISQREEAIQEIIEKLGPGPLNAKSLYLSSKDLKKLSNKLGVTIGSHSLSHPNLLCLTDGELRKELQDSKKVLEEITGQEVRHLSYPSGFWNERVIKVARKCGYVSAYSTARGIADNPYALPRINIGWWPDIEFRVKTSRLRWFR